jgi:hypothetical protein
LLPQLIGVKAKVTELQKEWQTQQSRALTPRQRLRQLEPSWLRNGQTTSLLASETEKDEVREDRGGIVSVDPTIQAGERLDSDNRNRESSQLMAIRIKELRIILFPLCGGWSCWERMRKMGIKW